MLKCGNRIYLNKTDQDLANTAINNSQFMSERERDREKLKKYSSGNNLPNIMPKYHRLGDLLLSLDKTVIHRFS